MPNAVVEILGPTQQPPSSPAYYQGGVFAVPHEGGAWDAHLAIRAFINRQDAADAREAIYDFKDVAKSYPDETRAVVEQYPWGSIRDGVMVRDAFLLELAGGNGTQPQSTNAQPTIAKASLYTFPADEGRLKLDRARKPIPRRYVVPEFLPAGITAILAGHGGSCKSLLALYFGIAVALGRPLFPEMPQCEPGAVLIALGEEDEAEAYRRLFAIAEQLNISDAEIALLGQRLLLYPCLGKDVRLTGHQSGLLVATGVSDRIIERMNEHAKACSLPAALAVLDHFLLFSGGKVNENEDAARFAQETGAIVAATGASVLTVAHSPKGDDGKKLDQHSVLGAVSTANLARLVLLVQRMTASEAKEMRISPDDRWRWLNLWAGKTNYTRAGAGLWLQEAESPYETVTLAPGQPQSVAAPEEDQAVALASAEALVTFLSTEAAQGIKHNRKSLDDAATAGRIPGLRRANARAALHVLMERKVVGERELPQGEQWGGRQSYLTVLRDLNVVERFI
jgi:RecA-family ATPase